MTKFYLKPSLILLSIFFVVTNLVGKESSPHIAYIYPGGGQKGTTFSVLVGGQNLQGVEKIYTSGSGIKAKILKFSLPKKGKKKRNGKKQENAQLDEKVEIKINIAKDAKIGNYEFRLITPNGYSNSMTFMVGDLHEQCEKENNNKFAKACQLEKLPLLVNGQIMPGDEDFFKFHAQKGKTLVCRVDARTLIPFLADAVPGWFQTVLILYDKNGKEVAFNDDFYFSPDSVLIYKVPETADYTLEIRDSIYRGREDFVYRISIGALPFIDHIYPLGGKRGTTVKIKLSGSNLPVQTKEVVIPNNAPAKMIIRVKGDGVVSNPVIFATSDAEEMEEQELNNSLEEFNQITLPITVNGKIESRKDEDYFVFQGKKGQKVTIDLLARRINSPLDAIITLMNKTGKVLVKNDDVEDKSEGLVIHHADPYLNYTLPVDGKYVIKVRDVQSKGGDAYSYRMFVGDASASGYALRIVPSSINISRGGSSTFAIHAIRKSGFKSPINLAIKNLPDGYLYSDAKILPNQNFILMSVTAPKNATIGVLPLKVVGKATVDDKVLVREAEPAEELTQAFIIKHLVPTKDFIVTIKDQELFTIHPQIEPNNPIILKPQQEFKLLVKVKRTEKCKQPIRIQAGNIPRGLRIKPVVIPANKNQAELTLFLPNGKPGFYNMTIKGAIKIKRKQTFVYSAVIPVTIVRPLKKGKGRLRGKTKKKK